MKSLTPIRQVLSAFVLIWIAACGGGGGDGGGGNVALDYSVTVSPGSVTVATGDTHQFSATVLNPNNTGVTWGVYGSGCQGSACGTITSTGLYTAPASVPDPPTVTVLATSKDDTSKADVATVTVVGSIRVSVSPQTANVATGGTQQFTAVVENTSNTAVNWSVTGTGCTGAACGTISSSGLYTAPSAVPDRAAVTVTATSQSDTGKSGTATVTIGGSALDRLSGRFVFQLSGFDANGAVNVAGLFDADGAGNITNGVLDMNHKAGTLTAIAFTGTYTLGADGRGEMTLSSTQDTSIYRFALSADNKIAQMIEFDTSGTRTSGALIQQDPGPFSNSTLTGDYVLSMSGTGTSGRLGAIGKFHADGAGNLTNGHMDVNDGLPNPPAQSDWSGNYGLLQNGRGVAAFNVAGVGTLHFIVYVVATDHHLLSEFPYLILVSTDLASAGSPLFAGQATLAFPGPWDNTAWSATSMLKVFAMAGKLQDGSGATAIAGTFASDGAGNLQNGVFHENRAGVISSSTNFSATYSIESSGRGTAVLHLTSTQTLPVIFYLRANDEAVLMSSPDPDVLLGTLVSAEGGFAPNNNGILTGNFACGPLAAPLPGMTLLTSMMSFDGEGHFSGTQDINFSSALMPDQAVSGTYAVGMSYAVPMNVTDGGQAVTYFTSLDSALAISSINSDVNDPMILVLRK